MCDRASRERELLLRWRERSSFTSLLRTHEGNAPAANAHIYDDDATIDDAARFSKVYATLAPCRTELGVDAKTRIRGYLHELNAHGAGTDRSARGVLPVRLGGHQDAP